MCFFLSTHIRTLISFLSELQIGFSLVILINRLAGGSGDVEDSNQSDEEKHRMALSLEAHFFSYPHINQALFISLTFGLTHNGDNGMGQCEPKFLVTLPSRFYSVTAGSFLYTHMKGFWGKGH